MVSPVGAVGTATTHGLVQDAIAARSTSTGEAGAEFAGMVKRGLESVSEAEFAADAAVQDVASGGPTRVEDMMIATTQAQLSIELLTKVRDRAVEAYQEVMRMPV